MSRSLNVISSSPISTDELSEDGFTLIELLIVIVILGILSGIAIFGVQQFRDDATTACTEANTRISTTVSAAQAANPSGTAYSTGGNCS